MKIKPKYFILPIIVVYLFTILVFIMEYKKQTSEKITGATKTMHNWSVKFTNKDNNAKEITESTKITEKVPNETTNETSNGINEIEDVENVDKIESVVDKEVQRLISLGEFKLTAYCHCNECCGEWASDRPMDEHGNEIIYGSTGEVLIEGMSMAVDPNVIPYGTEVIINGHKYKAQDCGGGINGNEIDVYFENHDDALEFGIQYAEVFLITTN